MRKDIPFSIPIFFFQMTAHDSQFSADNFQSEIHNATFFFAQNRMNFCFINEKSRAKSCHGF